jgi:hypothetical protein
MIRNRNIDKHDTFIFQPTRKLDAYYYGFSMDFSNTFRGKVAQKSYGLSLTGSKSASYASTGDSNDALLKISGNNYAANDTNFVFRGLNAAIANRSGGVLGLLEHSIGTQAKSGGTVTNLKGLSITAENYGTMGASGTFGGLDILLKNEAAVATTEFGLRIRNENNSIAGDLADAILISDTGANTGFTHFVDFTIDGGHPAQSTSSSVTNVGTNGWIKVKVGTATRYIALGDGVT